MKRRMLALLSALVCAVMMTACSQTSSQTAETTADAAIVTTTASVTTAEASYAYKTSDTDASYEADDTIYLDLDAITESVYRITAGGTYKLSGSYAGQILIEADDSEKVQLVLSGAHIACSDGPAVYALSTDKLIITLEEGTDNSLSDSTAYEQDEEGAVGALYSKSDVTINGAGSLTVNGNTAHGIVSKDDLVITGGVVTVNAVKDGLRGKDCVAVSGGTITINAGSDGIYSSETDADKGYVAIDGGSITITAAKDGIQAENAVSITGGTLQICCGGGSATVTLASDATGGGRSQYYGSAIAEDSTGSYKGLKSGGSISITGGDITLDTADDAIHAAGTITVTAGTFAIRSGDDAIHSDTEVVIGGGSFTIPYCYEGIEGMNVTINDGEISIISSDDGINAAGGADGSGLGGGWDDPFTVQSDCAVTINGGRITIVSDGDSIDSNGALTINGGTLNLTCNGNGNTAIDCNGTYANNGGSVTTNDGSESTGGGMGGGGMGGGKGGGTGGNPGGGTGGRP